MNFKFILLPLGAETLRKKTDNLQKESKQEYFTAFP